MEQIAQNTADSLTESVKEVNQFTQYFQGKIPGLMDLGIKLVIVLIAFFVCRKIIQLILKIFGRSFERAGMEAASAHFTLSIMKAIMYVMVMAVMATFLGVSGASVAALIGSMGVGVVLALKESLSNIAGGFILLFMKPFVSGDYIHEDTHGNEGTVVKVDLFYTTQSPPRSPGRRRRSRQRRRWRCGRHQRPGASILILFAVVPLPSGVINAPVVASIAFHADKNCCRQWKIISYRFRGNCGRMSETLCRCDGRMVF